LFITIEDNIFTERFKISAVLIKLWLRKIAKTAERNLRLVLMLGILGSIVINAVPKEKRIMKISVR